MRFFFRRWIGTRALKGFKTLVYVARMEIHFCYIPSKKEGKYR